MGGVKTEYKNAALVFSKGGTAKTAVKIHSRDCQVVERARHNQWQFSVVDGADDADDIEYEVRDLRERGWKINRCACFRR